MSRVRSKGSIGGGTTYKMQSQNSKHSTTTEHAEKTMSTKISYFHLFRYTTAVDKTLIVIAIIVTFLGGYAVSYVGNIYNNVMHVMLIHTYPNYSEIYIDGREQYDVIDTNPVLDDKLFMTLLKELVTSFCKIAFVVFLCSFVSTTTMKIASYKQIFKIRKLYLRAALNQDFAYYDERRDDLASKMGDIVISFEEGINDRVTNVLFSMVIVLTSIINAFTKSWKLTAFGCIIFVVMVALITFSVILARRYSIKEDEVMDRAGCVADEVLTAIRTVHAFGGKQKEIDRYGGFLQKAKSIFIKRELFVGILLGFSSFLLYVNYALIVLFGIYIKISEKAQSTDSYWNNFFAVVRYMFSSGLALRGIAAVMKSFGSALGAGAEIYELVDNVPKINPMLDIGEKLKNFQGNIEFKNVQFHYPSRPDTPVLKEVNLSIKRGQLVGLVGQSGSGKSTIFQLISRFYDVASGSVCLDGRDVRELSVQWLRAQIGLVTSEPVLFNCTVRENIRYGKEDASDAQVEAAARQANAHHFIMKLPKGYNTMVGERGASLSAGQKQRVAIARALVRDPALLLLDEATNALDTSSEAEFQKSLGKISENRTTLIAVNHLAMVQNVHMIYVLKQGQIVEHGSHSDLMEQKGYYYHMVKLQGMGLKSIKSKSQIRMEEDSSILNKTEVLEENIENQIASHEEEQKLDSISNWQVLALTFPDWKQMALGTLGSSFKNLGFPILALFYTDIFIFDLTDMNFLINQALKFLTIITILAVGMGFAAFMQEYMFGCAGGRLTHRLRCRMYAHLLRQDLAFFDRRNNSTPALCARMSGLTASIRRASGQPASYVVEGLMAMVFILVITLIYEIKITFFIMIFLPFLVIALYYQGQITNNESMEITEALEESMKVGSEAVTNFGLVASLGCEGHVLRRQAALLRAARRLALRSALCTGLVTGVSRALPILLTAAVAYYGGELLVKDPTKVLYIATILDLLYFMESHYINALLCSTEVTQGVASAKRIISGMQEEPAIGDPEVPEAVNFRATGNITLSNVYMTYPDQPIQALKGLSLDIKAGKTYALAGANGTGKSTVIKLLMRFYDPDSGEVAFDGIPLPRLRLADIRGSIGVVFEETILFERTIGENIAYGDNSRAVPEADVVEAAVQADIHGFIMSLPQGYHTRIGSKGTQLSTGQKQRVALARALVRKPTILLLDDATSNLDAESEKEVQVALDKAKEGRTVVSVTRSGAALRAADVVLVLHEGQLAERGTHDALMSYHGLYYALNKYL